MRRLPADMGLRCHLEGDGMKSVTEIVGERHKLQEDTMGENLVFELMG